jgi:hypothetical protein
MDELTQIEAVSVCRAPAKQKIALPSFWHIILSCLHHRNLLSACHFIYLASESRQLGLEWNSGCPGAKHNVFLCHGPQGQSTNMKVRCSM